MACFFASAYSVDIFLSISKWNYIPCRCNSIHKLIQKKKTEKKEENHGTNYEHRTIIIPTGIYFQNRKRRRGLFATIDLMEPK
jgi:hypothetical protein